MARYRLRYQSQDLEIPPGEFLVGRSRECQLALEDPLISRKHAAFTATSDKLFVEDLGSRNGVKVNGNKIAGRVPLSPGDIVTIGSQELVVGLADERANETRRLAAVTMTSEAAEPQHALLLLAGVVDKAFAMGRPEEAERILIGILNEVMVGLDAGRRDAGTLADATKYALRLGAETGKSSWLDWVFNAHFAAQRVLPAQTVDELYTTGRKLRYPVTPAVRRYVEWLREQEPKLTAPERFALKRIEGLVRVLMAS